MPILFRKVIFGKDYSSTKIPRKKIVWSGIFIFQKVLLLLTGNFGWTIALYMELTGNLLLRTPLKFICPCIKLTKAKHWSKACHDANLKPIKSLLNVTFGGNFNTLVTVSSLKRTILYKADYCSQRVVLPQPFILPKPNFWNIFFYKVPNQVS
jgi:hypothetical protein